MNKQIELFTSAIISFIFGILIIIFASLTYNSLKFDSNTVSKYSSNWNLHPVMSISKSTDIECPSDTMSLIGTKYPGTNKGCNCRLSTKDEFKDTVVYLNSCIENQIKNQCINIEDQSELNINKWRNTLLCAKYDNKITYSEIISNKYNSKCKPGFKICGYIDTQGNIFCIDQDSECPINYIEVLPSYASPSFIDGTQMIELEDSDYKLYYSNRNINGNILIQALVSGNDNMCISINEGYVGENQYILNKLKGEAECVQTFEGKKYDSRYTKLDSNTLYNLYKDNNINSVISILPNYPLNQYKNVSLIDINYIGIKKECYDISLNSLINPDHLSIKNPAYGLLLIIILDFIIIFCGFFAYRLYKMEELVLNKIIAVDVIHLELELIIISFSIYILSSLKKKVKSYNYFIDNSCGDDIMIMNFKHSYEDLNTSLKWSKVLVSFVIIEIITKTVYLFYFYFNNKDNYLKSD